MKKIIFLAMTLLVSQGALAAVSQGACGERMMYQVSAGSTARYQVTHYGLVGNSQGYRFEIVPMAVDGSYLNGMKVCVQTDLNCEKAGFYRPDQSFRCPWGYTR